MKRSIEETTKHSAHSLNLLFKQLISLVALFVFLPASAIAGYSINITSADSHAVKADTVSQDDAEAIKGLPPCRAIVGE